MTELTEQTFDAFIASKDKVAVDFYANWCGPCKAMLPSLEKADKEIPGRIAKVNVDTEMDLSTKYGIRSIPTVIIFQNGEIVEKKVGNFIQKTSDITDLLN